MAPSRIAFGSCNRQDRQNNFWSLLTESRQPAAFIWGGDAIYAGTYTFECVESFHRRRRCKLD